MTKIEICGGRRLEGNLRIHGAKNSVLPIIAATVLNSGKATIHDCPNLSDVNSAFNILKNLGCTVDFNSGNAYINSTGIDEHYIPDNLMREMRSSVMFLGAIIARCKKAVISYPGGCELGPRPIDLHLKAFRQLGVNIEEIHGYINCSVDKIIGTNIHLAFPSVGATENIMLLTAMSEGTTVITNAAREPEIVDLQNFLNAMGANITGGGNEEIIIHGVPELHDVEHTVIPDRIVTATYLCAIAACGGDVTLNNVEPAHIHSVTSVLSDAGCEINVFDNSIHIKSDGRLNAVNMIKTLPHPGFPTDAQAPMMAALSIAEGTSMFIENMFENRYKHAEELVRMGADITIEGRVAVVKGVPELFGASVKAADLRGGAALVIAGLAAKGITEINSLTHIDRGYECIERDFMKLGANILRK